MRGSGKDKSKPRFPPRCSSPSFPSYTPNSGSHIWFTHLVHTSPEGPHLTPSCLIQTQTCPCRSSCPQPFHAHGHALRPQSSGGRKDEQYGSVPPVPDGPRDDRWDQYDNGLRQQASAFIPKNGTHWGCPVALSHHGLRPGPHLSTSMRSLSCPHSFWRTSFRQSRRYLPLTLP